VSRFADTLDRLAAVIASRRGADPAASWSARLLADPPLAAKKLAEEAVETALAAVQQDRAALVAESADLIYHYLVLLAAAGVPLDAVAAELEAREGRSGVEEKASRANREPAPSSSPRTRRGGDSGPR
jgi:phosphoribosyl-ATP pyrophosphohydrolase